ncbi:MAG: integrase family protein, partial [Pseudonocardia sp.]|uniref:tyrosine-type recombinase/integrase n=1 Tax=Pseudonocardia sp. TaxID=60912 RepID=UPI0026182D1A
MTKRRHYLREVVPPGPTAWADAEKVVRRLANQVDERKHPKTSATVNQLLDQHFELLTLERSTMDTYVRYADKHIRPFIGRASVGSLDAGVFDSLYAELRRCRDHCDRSAYIEHRTERAHECDPRCRPHVCTPLSASTIRQVHFVLSGALKRAVRWRWLATNPIMEAEPPPAPRPSPRPPSAQEAARILAEAWKDPDWGLLVWVAMVTGLRRGELCGIRWRHVDLNTGVLALERSIGQRSGQTWEKDTKTHQQRRIALDPETVALLAGHQNRCLSRAGELGLELSPDAFLFSLAPDGSTHLLPDSVSQRYGKLAKRLGIQTSIHKLRHYSATELIAAGVDVRTVAGRLGHAGGGTTTLRVYAAWVSESDQRAATSLFSRMPARPLESRSPLREPRYPYEKLAAAILDEIAAGRFEVGAFLPGQ